jgi:signal transduction histidine kinase
MPDCQKSDTEAPNAAAPTATTTAKDRLLAETDRILTLWEQRLREEVPAARGEPGAILIDTLPALLVQLAEALSGDHPRRMATQGSTIAQEHGGERVRVTRFALEDVIAEYRILRQVLSDVLEQTGPLTAAERHILNTSIDHMIVEACTAYGLVQSTFRDRFFATIAHDLRNPLNTAQAAAALIGSRPQAPEVAEWAGRILENIGRVDRMVQDVLNAMRVQAGARLQLEIEPCDLVVEVRRTLDRLRLDDGMRIVLHAPAPVRGYAAPDVLHRALENLIDNAVKYGAPSRPITVAVHEKHGRAILTVHNHGTPIPAEQQETLFRAFQRLTAAEASGKKGWGLGLAQVRAVAEAHGGSIGVDSLPGRGTTFTIDIPLDARPFQHTPITGGAADADPQ